MDIKLKLLLHETLAVLSDNYQKIKDTAIGMDEDIQRLNDNLDKMRVLVEKLIATDRGRT